MLLLINTLVVAVTIHCLLSLTGIRRFVDYFLAAALGFTAELFLIAQVLSLFHLLAPLPFFISEMLVLSLVLFFWNKKGRPAAISLADMKRIWGDAKAFFADYRRNWPFFVLILLAAYILFTQALNAALNFNNTVDMVHYHYPKVALWLQYGSIFSSREQVQFLVDKRLAGSPPVYEILCTFYVLWTHTLRGIGIIEIGGVLSAILAIYGITRQITSSRKAALISALVFLSFPVVIHDLSRPDATITALAFFLMGFYFFQRAEREGFKRPWIALSSLSYVFAFLAKPTIYLLIPAIFVIILFSVLVLKTERRWAVLRDWVVITAILFALFGAGITTQNAILFSDPLLLDNWNMYPTSESFNKEGCLVTNAARYIYNRTTPSLYPSSLQKAALSAYTAVGQSVFDTLGIDVTSSNCIKWPFSYESTKPGLNLTGLLLLIVSLVFSANKMQEERGSRLWILLFWISQVLLFSLSRVYTPTTFRYFASSAAFLAILAGDFFERISSKKLLLLAVTGVLFYSGIIQNTMYQLDLASSTMAKEETISDDGNIRDTQATIFGLIPPGSSIVLSVQDVLMTDVAYWGTSLENTVLFSDCGNLYNSLLANQPDFLVYSGKYRAESDHWGLTKCLDQYYTEQGNRLNDLLGESYTAIYEGWHNSSILTTILQRNDSVPLYAEFPPIKPIIFIDDSLDGVIGGGPYAYFSRRVGLDGYEFLFGLRTLEPQEDIPVSITFTGQTCSLDRIIGIVVYDHLAQLIYSQSIPLDQNDISFTTDLGDGANWIFIEEEGCDEAVYPTFRIKRITVGPLSE